MYKYVNNDINILDISLNFLTTASRLFSSSLLTSPVCMLLMTFSVTTFPTVTLRCYCSNFLLTFIFKTLLLPSWFHSQASGDEEGDHIFPI